MKKSAEIAERVKRLREELGGLTQDQLGDRLGTGRAAVSQWEAEIREPTAEAYLKLGIEAKEPELRRWFWEQSGFDLGQLLLAAAGEWKALLPPSQLVKALLDRVPALPENAEPFTVPEGMAGPFPPGDVFMIEPAADPQAPRPFWDQLVLMNFPPEERPSEGLTARWPKGLHIGRLRCGVYYATPGATLTYWAIVVPVNDSATGWGPGSEVFPVGLWTHASPPEEPIPGTARAKAEEEKKRAWAERELVYRKAYRLDRPPEDRGGAVEITPEMKMRDEAFSKAQDRVTRALDAELRQAEEQAKSQAPGMIRLSEGALIVGRVIAWFAGPKGKE